SFNRWMDQPPSNRPLMTGTYYPGLVAIPRKNTPNFFNRSFSITAEAEIPARGAEGALLALGGRFSGFTLFVQNDRLNFVYNFFGLERYSVVSTEAVPKGSVKLRLEF